MTIVMPLTIIASMYSVPMSTLAPQLWQLSHQTVSPLEILIICASPDAEYRAQVHETCKPFDLVRVIDAPQHGTFGTSHACNVGIKASSPGSQFISCIAAGLLFNATAIEALSEAADPRYICEAQMALLPADYELGDIETLWQRWDDLTDHLDEFSRSISFAPGSLSCVSRKWLFDIHGYDETNYPMAYNDSDIHHRAQMSGIALRIIPWDKMQMVHIIHERRYALPTMPNARDHTSIIRNGDKWGDYA